MPMIQRNVTVNTVHLHDVRFTPVLGMVTEIFILNLYITQNRASKLHLIFRNAGDLGGALPKTLLSSAY